MKPRFTPRGIWATPSSNSLVTAMERKRMKRQAERMLEEARMAASFNSFFANEIMSEVFSEAVEPARKEYVQ